MIYNAGTQFTWFRLLGAALLFGSALISGKVQAQNPDSGDAGLAVYKALLPKAEAGDAEVQTALGLMRLRGDVVERDLKVARVWLGKAAMQNHTPAQYYLGQLLLLDVFNANQPDLSKQLTEGLGWLRRASETNTTRRNCCTHKPFWKVTWKAHSDTAKLKPSNTWILVLKCTCRAPNMRCNDSTRARKKFTAPKMNSANKKSACFTHWPMQTTPTHVTG